MNRAHCTLEVYNFLWESPVAGHLFVCVGGTKGPAPRTKRPSGRLQRAGTAAGPAPSLYTGPRKTSEKRRLPCQTPQGAKETHFHPRPPSRVNKVITSQGGCPQSAKRQIICLMAGEALWAAVLLKDCSVYCFLWRAPLSAQLSCKVGLKQRISKGLVKH